MNLQELKQKNPAELIIEAEGLKLFEYIKGDINSIMGLPIKDIINYINQYKL